MSTNFNCCNSVSRYVPNKGAEDAMNRITNKTTPEEFEQIRNEFPQFQLLHPTNNIGFTVLHKAAQVGNVPLIQYLVKQAPELLERSEMGFERTPLFMAYNANQIDAMQTLLELGANPSIMYRSGNTYISFLQHIAAQQQLVQMDIDLFGEPVKSTQVKSAQAMKLLLKYGAERQPEDDEADHMDLPGIKSLIQMTSQEMAEEQREVQRKTYNVVFESNLLPPSDVCKLVCEFI
jgi:ankyrin repeat protein